MLRPLRDEDLEMVLGWRNLPAVRANMYNTHEISLEEHRAWWARTANDPTARYFVFEDEGEPAGVVAFTQISGANRSASWAFYARENARKGVGTRMEVAALRKAFDDLELLKLNCEVLSHNLRVVRMHQKFGFRVEGIFRKHHQAGEQRLDVYRLALFASDWKRHLARQAEEIAATGKPAGVPTVGDRYAHALTISRAQIERFGQATGDLNPIHFDDGAAQAAGFEGRIAHGVLLLGEISRVLGTVFPGKGTIIASMNSTFQKPAYPDRLLELSIEVLGMNGQRRSLNVEVRDGDALLLRTDVDVVIPGQ